MFDMNLTDGDKFPHPLIQRVKSIFNQKIKFPHDTKPRICKISIMISWNSQIVQILHDEHDGELFFKENLPTRVKKPLGLSHKGVSTNLKYQEPAF